MKISEIEQKSAKLVIEDMNNYIHDMSTVDDNLALVQVDSSFVKAANEAVEIDDFVSKYSILLKAYLMNGLNDKEAVNGFAGAISESLIDDSQDDFVRGDSVLLNTIYRLGEKIEQSELRQSLQNIIFDEMQKPEMSDNITHEINNDVSLFQAQVGSFLSNIEEQKKDIFPVKSPFGIMIDIANDLMYQDDFSQNVLNSIQIKFKNELKSTAPKLK